ncbi:MAG TPA: response regulator [Burkholderiales bacterium]|jgi:CheY-like chemotaxis protein|nr:response regulator [Burkholderiales bacterium]
MTTNTKGPLRVLIADDNRDAVMVLSILLRSEGYDVRLAQGGKEALAQAAEFRPHVALLDLEMPDCSGFRVAQELSRGLNGEPPVLVAVTACTEAEAREMAQVSGFQHFVSKPYNHQAMLKLLASLPRR